jgi:hypothetical protein
MSGACRTLVPIRTSSWKPTTLRPALRDEYRRLQPYMAPMPQCLVNATTPQGDIVLSYRLYAEGGRTLVEVRQVP